MTAALPLDPREAAAIAAFLAATKRSAVIVSPEHVALWFRTTPEGKALGAALRRYDAAIAEHGPRMVTA